MSQADSRNITTLNAGAGNPTSAGLLITPVTDVHSDTNSRGRSFPSSPISTRLPGRVARRRPPGSWTDR